MPFKRLVDYTGVTIWIFTIIFILGGLYWQQLNNTSNLVKHDLVLDAYEKKNDLIEKQILSLQMQSEHQEEWKEEFMTTFKDLVVEMKTNNEAILNRMQSTDNSVLRASFQLDAINAKLKTNANLHIMPPPPFDDND